MNHERRIDELDAQVKALEEQVRKHQIILRYLVRKITKKEEKEVICTS